VIVNDKWALDVVVVPYKTATALSLLGVTATNGDVVQCTSICDLTLSELPCCRSFFFLIREQCMISVYCISSVFVLLVLIYFVWQ